VWRERGERRPLGRTDAGPSTCDRSPRDPSGLVEKISWSHWGQRTATGWGETSIFTPHGGYYPQLVRSKLRATRLGQCTKNGRRAYTHLEERVPSHPGGALGKWFAWSGEKSICHLPSA
jgi:hypothetical protein